MPPELLDLIARLTGGDNVQPLTDAEIVTLREQLAARADELADAELTDDTVTELGQIADAVTACDSETQARAEQAAERQRQRDEALARIRPTQPEQAEEPPAVEESAPVEEPQAVAAAATPAPRRPTPAAMQRAVPQAARPRPAVQPTNRLSAALIASADVPQVGRQELNSVDDLARALFYRWRTTTPASGRAIVASAIAEWPEERRLSAQDVEHNERIFNGLLQAALVASGGICAPVNVDYSVPVFSDTERPIRDALPSFNASRGGVTFIQPPVYSSSSGAGVAVWTAANDANPGSPATKPVLTIACPGTTTVYVEAVTSRVRMGNMQGRFSPEVVAAVQANAAAWHAHIGELELLNAMVANSTVTNYTGAGTGAAPELLSGIEQDIASQRYVLRNSRISFTVVLPFYARPMLRADVARRLATDTQEQNGGALAVTDAEIDNWFSVRGINPVYTLDAIAASTATSLTYPLQGLAAPAGSGAHALSAYPAKTTALIFPTGSYEFLDGGQLDVGVIRDSTLNNTNDYEQFMETFEGLAFRGVISHQLIVPTVAGGMSGGTVDTHSYANG